MNIEESLGLEDTTSGFPIARGLSLTTPGGAMVINLVTADGRLIRQQVSKLQLASFFIDTAPHVVRV